MNDSLVIENLTVEFPNNRVLDNVSITAKKGRVLGIVGESGSGKTMTVLSAMGLLAENAKIVSGSIKLNGKELIGLNEKEISQIRGNDMTMIFQEPMTSLNPTMKIGKQVEECVLLHGYDDKNEEKLTGIGRAERKKKIKNRVLESLSEVMLKNPEKIYGMYPHELSGGMRQRVMIAMGIICRPDFLICDEPTTALDVTTEKEILKLINKLKCEFGMGIIFITHDLKLLRNFADEVVVMSEGRVVESGTPEKIFTAPEEEYTKRLITSIPDRKRRRRENV